MHSTRNPDMVTDPQLAARIREAQATCGGYRDCPAEVHIHGCYADRGNCLDPQEHQTRASGSGVPRYLMRHDLGPFGRTGAPKLERPSQTGAATSGARVVGVGGRVPGSGHGTAPVGANTRSGEAGLSPSEHAGRSAGTARPGVLRTEAEVVTEESGPDPLTVEVDKAQGDGMNTSTTHPADAEPTTDLPFASGESDTRHEDPYASFLIAAHDLGTDHGTNAAEWFAQECSTVGARFTLRGMDDGDPMVMDELPWCDLSGEWADGSTPQSVAADVGWDADPDDEDDALTVSAIADAYEEGYNEAMQAEVERLLLGIVGDGS